jgi:hypothetical protein
MDGQDFFKEFGRLLSQTRRNTNKEKIEVVAIRAGKNVRSLHNFESGSNIPTPEDAEIVIKAYNGDAKELTETYKKAKDQKDRERQLSLGRNGAGKKLKSVSNDHFTGFLTRLKTSSRGTKPGAS